MDSTGPQDQCGKRLCEYNVIHILRYSSDTVDNYDFMIVFSGNLHGRDRRNLSIREDKKFFVHQSRWNAIANLPAGNWKVTDSRPRVARAKIMTI